MVLPGSFALGISADAETGRMDRQDKQNLRDLLWQDRAAGAGSAAAGKPGRDPAQAVDPDVLWARMMISELSADPAIWSTPTGADPDWALADLHDDAGFLDDLMSGAALLGGDDGDDVVGLPALGPDPALDDLFADLTATAPKPRRRLRPPQQPANPALDDIFAQTAADSAPESATLPELEVSQDIAPDPDHPWASGTLADPASDSAAENPRGFLALKRVFLQAGRRRGVDR